MASPAMTLLYSVSMHFGFEAGEEQSRVLDMLKCF